MSESVLSDEGFFCWFEGGDISDTSQSIAGTLQISENGQATISLVGLLPNGDSPMAALFQYSPLDPGRSMLGVLKSGRFVILRRIRPNGTTLSSTLSHQRFLAGQALLFKDLEVPVNLERVTKLTVDVDSLGEWAAEPAVVYRVSKRGASARAKKPKDRVFRLEQKTLRLRSEITATQAPGWPAQSISLSQRSRLETVPRTPWSVGEALDEFTSLEDLLLLLADVDVALEWPTLNFGRQSARFYFERRRSESKNVALIDSWASLRAPSLDLGGLLQRLEYQRQFLGPGLYLYLGIRRAPSLYLENRFSTAIFGIESLHRKSGPFTPQTKLEEKVSRIIGDVKRKRDRDWLSARLRNAAEPSLEERIFATLSELDLGFENKSLRLFSKECADVRNQIAHFGGHRDGTYETFIRRMYVLNAALRPLYHAVLLTRIGLSVDHIYSYFFRSPLATKRRRTLNDAGLILSSPPAGQKTENGRT